MTLAHHQIQKAGLPSFLIYRQKIIWPVSYTNSILSRFLATSILFGSAFIHLSHSSVSVGKLNIVVPFGDPDLHIQTAHVLTILWQFVDETESSKFKTVSQQYDNGNMKYTIVSISERRMSGLNIKTSDGFETLGFV